MPFSDAPGARRRLRGVAAVLTLLMLGGCAGTAVSAIAPGSTTGPEPALTTISSTPDDPGVTVPPLPGPVTAEIAPETSPPPPSPDASPTAVAPPPAAEPPPAPAPTPDPVPAPEPPPAAAVLPALMTPYAHVLGSHGDARTVYLTFDDGPGPQTPAVLDALASAGVKATFCQVGDRIVDYAAAEQRVIAEGHTVCNHSWDHQSHLGSADAGVIDAEIARTQDALAAAGATAHYFRAPGGDFGTTDTLRQVAQTRGVVPLGWAVDSLDWTKPGVDAIVTNVLTAVSPGAVVLMHDAGGADRDQTVAALPRIIDGLRAAGYDLQPLPPGGI